MQVVNIKNGPTWQMASRLFLLTFRAKPYVLSAQGIRAVPRDFI
jgi:hypothetical protein